MLTNKLSVDQALFFYFKLYVLPQPFVTPIVTYFVIIKRVISTLNISKFLDSFIICLRKYALEKSLQWSQNICSIETLIIGLIKFWSLYSLSFSFTRSQNKNYENVNKQTAPKKNTRGVTYFLRLYWQFRPTDFVRSLKQKQQGRATVRVPGGLRGEGGTRDKRGEERGKT